MAQNPFILTLFRTPVNYHHIDFKTLCSYARQNTLQIDSFQDPYIGLHSVFILHGRLPSKINSFRTILHSEFWIPFKTPVTHMSHSVNGLISRPFRRGKEHRAQGSTVLVTFQTPFKTLYHKSNKTQDNKTDHSPSSLHCRGNVIVPNKHFSDF